MNKKKNRQKIFERNPNTGVIRWRYTDESPDKFGWTNYGRILNDKKKEYKQKVMILKCCKDMIDLHI